jgi:hypothetical protein
MVTVMTGIDVYIIHDMITVMTGIDVYIIHDMVTVMTGIDVYTGTNTTNKEIKSSCRRHTRYEQKNESVRPH